MKVTLEFDENSLHYTDSYLAALWHAAQWNRAPAADPEACRGVELIGREIIRRWLANTPPELWHRQGSHQQSLPAIERDAKARDVIEAARKVVEQDHGANIPLYREQAIQSVRELEKALASMGTPERV